MQDRFKRLMAIFAEATELPTQDRSEFLAEVGLQDQTLYNDVVALIEAEAGANGLLDRPITIDLTASLTGTRIGPYVIGGELGRGGMGAVYQATRDDGEFEQQVAIKISNRTFLSHDLERRFKAERQILAKLTHPNIVHLFDGGVTADKVPYFVMELVSGVPITSFCRERSLGIGERLRLFRQVCAAVQYAHQHLIVHRDLKPSNILVTNEGKVKLLDFGIAKVIGGEAETQTVNAPITPEYASPEQILDRPISTASDIYTLGVILYELLTERTPAEIYGTGRTDISRGIREVEPQKPSAVSRQPMLRGDLDNIILKCLEKDVQRRYSSVEQLANDIGRYLHGYPVGARTQSFGYRSAKFVKRNKLPIAIAASAVVLLVAAASVAVWQAIAARRAQARAEANFLQVRKIANSLILDYHDEIAKLSGSITLRERIVSDAVNYLNAISAEDSGDPELEREMAAAYRKIAAVQGMSYSENLGKIDDAIVNEAKAIRLLYKASQLRPGDLSIVDDFTASLVELDQLLSRRTFDRYDFPLMARQINDLAIAAEPGNFERRLNGLRLQIVEAGTRTTPFEIGSIDRLYALNSAYLALIETAEELQRLRPDDLRLLNTAGGLFNRLSNTSRWIGMQLYLQAGRPDLARPYFEESVKYSLADKANYQKVLALTPGQRRNMRTEYVLAVNLANALPYLGKLAEAEKSRAEAKASLLELRKYDPKNLELDLDELALVKSELEARRLEGRNRDAIRLADEGLAILDRYEKAANLASSIEVMTWRGFLLKAKLELLRRTNTERPEIDHLEKRLEDLEQNFTAAGGNLNDLSGITIG